MRVVRWILITVAALVLLAALTLVSITLLINPDRYRGEIQRVVSRAAGRPFLIEGHLRLSWFPGLGVRMGAARLGTAPGQPGPDLIDWHSARLRVGLLPLLLHRQVVIGTVHLRGAVIHLWRGPDGRGNWQGLFGHAPGAGAPALPVVGGVVLTDGALYLEERGRQLGLTHWQLHVGAWRPGRPLAIRTRFVLHGRPLPPAGVRVQLRIPWLRLEAAPLTVSVRGVGLQVADATVTGLAALSRGTHGLSGSGAVAFAVPSVRKLIGLLGIRMRLPENRTTLGRLALSGRWRLNDGTLSVKPLVGRFDATTLTGWVDYAGARKRWTFALHADRIDFAGYLPPTRTHRKPWALPVRALRALHARGTLTIGQARIGGTTLRDLRLQVQ